MASRLISRTTHESENSIELSLEQSFHFLEPQLRPPFPLTIPSDPDYLNLNRAILYGILCEPQLAKVHIKHLHGIVTDGYRYFTATLIGIVDELYTKLVEPAKVQLIWVTSEMVNVSAVGIDCLLVALLRQIVGGDFSDGNLWLCFELVSLFLSRWDCLLDEHPLVLSSALYAFLRLLADHYRVSSNSRVDVLKKMEIDFCIRVLKEQFHLALNIGRDFVRLLQDLVHVPKFGVVWKDLILNPGEFRTPGFSDVSQLYCWRTSSQYFLLRITPEMETQLRFLLTHVKLGSQKRYQAWFARKFLCMPERETLVIDIVRFICSSHHPPNEIIHSDVLPRWAVIGWLLKSCRKNYVEANVKLALFYDWLFFNERVDNLMNIEPAILLIVNSLPKYVDMTQTLLEFLFLLVDYYDIDRKYMIFHGVSSALNVLVSKGVVRSLDVLTSCQMFSPFMKERLEKLLSGAKMNASKEFQSAHFPCHTLPPLQSPLSSDVGLDRLQGELRLAASRDNGLDSTKPVDEPFPDEQAISCTELTVPGDIPDDALENLVKDLAEITRNSKHVGLQTLDKILFSFLYPENQDVATDSVLTPEILSCEIAKTFELCGYKLFDQNSDEDAQSASALITRYLVISRDKRMESMFSMWSSNGFPMGAFLLSYAASLAHEAQRVGCLENLKAESRSSEVCESGMSLLKLHVELYFRFMVGKRNESPEFIFSASNVNSELVAELVDGAFAAYRSFLMNRRNCLHKESDTSMAKLLCSDLTSCAEWDRKRLKLLLCSIFCHLPDFSIGEEDFMRLLVGQLDHSDLLDMQFEIAVGKVSLFGESAEAILHLINTSFGWGFLEQHKFWGLIRSELSVSKVQMEKVILGFFCSDVLDRNVTSIAVSGLLALCSCCAPTPELVGAIMLLPHSMFSDFATAILATWAASNSSMLFESVEEFLKKFKKDNSLVSDLREFMINESAFLWLLKFLDAKGDERHKYFEKLV